MCAVSSVLAALNHPPPPVLCVSSVSMTNKPIMKHFQPAEPFLLLQCLGQAAQRCPLKSKSVSQGRPGDLQAPCPAPHPGASADADLPRQGWKAETQKGVSRKTRDSWELHQVESWSSTGRCADRCPWTMACGAQRQAMRCSFCSELVLLRAFEVLIRLTTEDAVREAATCSGGA